MAPLPPIVAAVRSYVDDTMRPVARSLEQPQHPQRLRRELVEHLRELGLFGALVPQAYGGLGLDVTTYARVIEELCPHSLSVAGALNSHMMAALVVLHHGTEGQRGRFLPSLARGDARGSFCLTEHGDVEAVRTVARRRDDDYLLNSTMLFVTTGCEGNTFAVLALTGPETEPHRGMSCFIVEQGGPGLLGAGSPPTLGPKGVDTAEVSFRDFAVPATNLVGGVEGRGFRQVTSALQRTLLARQLVQRSGERLESFTRRESGRAAVGQGSRMTAEAQAVQERSESDRSPASEASSRTIDRARVRRQMVLGVRQFVDTQVIPAGQRTAPAPEPEVLLKELAQLGALGATAPTLFGGLDLDLPAVTLIVEELARGSVALATQVTEHLAAVHALTYFGDDAQRQRLLPPMTRGELLGALTAGAPIEMRPDRDGWTLHGTTLVTTTGAGLLLIPARSEDKLSYVLVDAAAPGHTFGTPVATLSAGGFAELPLTFHGERVSTAAVLGGVPGQGQALTQAAQVFARVAVAATAIGVAQAALEAALRFLRQRSTLAQPVDQLQPISLRLADMAPVLTAARLLTEHAAETGAHDLRHVEPSMAKLLATETARAVTLAAMRIHTGQGYLPEFPFERYHRDAIGLALALGGNERERLALARRLSGTEDPRSTAG